MERLKNIFASPIARVMIVFILLIVVNLLSSRFYQRFDLTQEKRYTLSAETSEMLQGLDDIIQVKIYLDGPLDPDYLRLKQETQDLLYEFNDRSGDKIEYEFINPQEGEEEARLALEKELLLKQIRPEFTKELDENGIPKKVWPAMTIRYRSNEVPVQLLEQSVGFNDAQLISNSIELLEYKIANGIRKVYRRQAPRIGIIQGHGELPPYLMGSFLTELEQQLYQVKLVNLNQERSLVNQFEAIIIARPTQKFQEKEKFVLDQYLTHGGSIIWLIDPVEADLDSLQGSKTGEFYALNRDLNLTDQLFKYGVRVNTNLIQDYRALAIPLTGQSGGPPKLYPWHYYPAVASKNEHVITKNLDLLTFKFASTIDVIQTKLPLKKTVLLSTSDHSKALRTPVRIRFGNMMIEPDPAGFPQQHLPVAVLVEGEFESLFKGRLKQSTKQMLDSLDIEFIAKGKPAKMIVIGDGDVIRNEVDNNGQPFPLGYYRFQKMTFANSEFLLNCIEYLTEDSPLIETRNKEIRLRLLNRAHLKEETSFLGISVTTQVWWQLATIVIPVFFVILFGFVYNFIRRRRYAK